ncbi:MAG: prepilin-type N-terminal cleavage/methylation domain-containing protein [Bacilli bacterium]|nr:prepilin-type N-terminal cleavage/methylation domain-containing protein [Bacilli bacterium]
MNKKGFTLVEIIGVIAIIGILGIVTAPIITGVLSDSNNKIDKNQEKLIIGAARSYAIKQAFEIKANDCVKVSTLIKDGFLESFDNSANDDSVNYNDYVVEITKSGSTYNYEIKTSSDRACK